MRMAGRWYFGVAAIALFLVPVTLIMHNFRTLTGFAAQTELHAFTGNLQIGRGPDRRGRHHFDFCGVAAGFFRAFADKAKGPFDQIRIGKLQDDAVTNAPGGA